MAPPTKREPPSTHILDFPSAGSVNTAAAWLEAVARATGQPWPPAPVEQETAAPANAGDAQVADPLVIAPPVAPANFTAATHPFFAGANAKLWDDAAQ